jgi:hypothetical protein
MQLTAPKISQEIRDGFDPEPPVSAISTPNLTDAEASALLKCINEVRAGRKMFYVRLANRRTTNGRRRMPGVDYQADPGLTPNAHEGWMYAAPTNKKKKVYLRLKDEARAKPDQEPELDPETGEPLVRWNYTSITMEGILAFKVIGNTPGPTVPVETAAPVLDATAQQALLSEAFQMGMKIQSQAQAALNPSPHQPPTAK